MIIFIVVIILLIDFFLLISVHLNKTKSETRYLKTPLNQQQLQQQSRPSRSHFRRGQLWPRDGVLVTDL